MIVKLVFVGAVWVVGLLIDNITEPRFRKLAPAQGEKASEAFILIQKKHLALEVIGTLLFYIIFGAWSASLIHGSVIHLWC